MTMKDLILGTAGHIDHGKTSLIRALTGVNTDRLPEEKRRGITIELGFAELTVGDFRLGVVDVPGHERFIRNMLCGATGMDLVMLVIAADDSINQQTREHLDILRLLDLRAGVIVLTKIDLVDPDWLDLVEAEIRDFVAGTFLERSPIVRTSTVTGAGLDVLRRELEVAARQVSTAESPEGSSPFRLAIDRSFTIAGHGTVVTGSVSSGECHVGDELELQPCGIGVRVRGLQSHDRPAESVHHGQRAAINLVGVHHEEIGRGQQLCSPGHLRPSKLLTVSLTVLRSSSRSLANRSRLKFHLGTAELGAVVRLLDRDVLAPGESGTAQMFLSEPTVSVWNQPFVIRFESPAETAGGGRVLDPNAERIRKADAETLEMIYKLGDTSPLERASAALFFSGFRDWLPADLSRTAGVAAPQSIAAQLLDRGELREITVSPTRKRRVHRLVLARLYDRLEAALVKLHEQFPLRTVFDPSLLTAGFAYLGDDAILTAALQDMARSGRIRRNEHGVSVVGHGPKLSANEQKLLVQLIDLFRQAGMQPPSVKECQQQAAKHQAAVPQLLSLAVANGDLVEIGPELFLHTEVEKRARELLVDRLTPSAGMPAKGLTVSEIRELLNTSRKYAVPYCEFLDRIGFTERQGDVRHLARPPLAETTSSRIGGRLKSEI